MNFETAKVSWEMLKMAHIICLYCMLMGWTLGWFTRDRVTFPETSIMVTADRQPNNPRCNWNLEILGRF